MTSYKPVEWPEPHPISSFEQFTRPQKQGGEWVLAGSYYYQSNATENTVLYGCFPLAGLVGLGLFSVYVFSQRQELWSGLLFGLLGLGWAVIILKLMQSGLKQSGRQKKERGFGPPELLLPDERLRLGETVDLTFRRRLRGGEALSQNVKVHARLLWVEVTRREWGTDIVYDREFLIKDWLEAQT